MVSKAKQSKVAAATAAKKVATPSPAAKAQTSTKPAVPAAVVDEADEADEDDEEDVSDSDDEGEDGITEEGMERLMAALGEDGIDDFDMAQLGEEDDEDEDEEDDENEEDEESVIGEEDNEDDEEDEEMISEDEEEGAQDGEEEEQDLALDDLESDLSVDEDAVPHRKVTINNRTAMSVLRRQLEITSAPWPEHLTLTTREDHSEVDAGDDLKRELAFYKQAISVVAQARKLCAKHDVPFTRPKDYYAEMVKSDAHMERVRTRLVDEASSIKKSEAAKKQRDLKKYGKQIQVEKLKSRQAEKKGLDERLKGIKRKRAGGAEIGADADDGDFDVALDDAIEGRGGRGGGRGGRSGRGGRDGPKMPRHARDAKYSMGGGGRRSKQNTKESTDDFSGFRGSGSGGRGGRGGRGGAARGGNRPGKSRRHAGRT